MALSGVSAVTVPTAGAVRESATTALDGGFRSSDDDGSRSKFERRAGVPTGDAGDVDKVAVATPSAAEEAKCVEAGPPAGRLSVRELLRRTRLRRAAVSTSPAVHRRRERVEPCCQAVRTDTGGCPLSRVVYDYDGVFQGNGADFRPRPARQVARAKLPQAVHLDGLDALFSCGYGRAGICRPGS